MHANVSFPDGFGTRFCVTVDTEETFDWDGPFSRVEHHLGALPTLAEGQGYFARAGVVPTYFVDYPVARNFAAIDALGQAAADGAAEIGTHLHPWVTPPYVEDVNRHNSYVGNLPHETESAKLDSVTTAIERAFGRRPTSYRAGRYGIGPNTAAILHAAGYRIDSSVRPLFDYRNEGGPDFSDATSLPYWFGPDDSLLELPLGCAYTGWAGRRFRPWLFSKLNGTGRLQGLAARSRLLTRVPLTPEGTPPDLACAAIDRLQEDGAPVLVMSFHSPSLAIGHSPYVRTAADLKRFYGWFDTVFDHCARKGIAPASLALVHAAASGAHAECALDSAITSRLSAAR